MSLVNLANVCSHLQNATKARLGMTSVPHTKLILALMLGFQKEGFISTITRGSIAGPDEVYTQTTQANIASRRLWLGLKYYDNEPVMSKIELLSKPKQRLWLNVEQLKMIANGREAGFVKPLNPGECIFVSTDRGVMELREAVKKITGGQ